MSGRPEVSVVIGVRGGASRLMATLRSVLDQDGVALECLVVDDGSPDDTAARVTALARHEPRVRLLRQAAAGLTRALINGCGEARAPLIARIDAGDRMLPGRLAHQCRVLAAEPALHVLATGLRLCGPRGEILSPPPPPARDALTDLTADFRSLLPTRLAGCAHMTVCLRRDAYRRAGGYRGAFRLAQDVDLWTRMAEAGSVARLEAVLTEARIALDGLSPRHHRVQQRLRALAAAAARARREDGDEDAVLARAERVSREALATASGGGAAACFVVGCLVRRGRPREAERYFRLALRREPASVRALVGCARARVLGLATRTGLSP